MKFQSNSFTYSPSDVVNYLGCQHLTQLDRLVAQGQLKKPDWNSPALAALQQMGFDHEEGYIEHLEQQGKSVKRLDGERSAATLEAMQEGHDIITQARLTQTHWQGYADLLIKVPGDSTLGDYHYEVADTKLAQITKSGTIIQLCYYAECLETLQGRKPAAIHVIKPGEDFPTESYQVDHFLAYYRQIKNDFLQNVDLLEGQTYPDPVSKCNTCRWWKACNDQRHADDHLSLIAGIRKGQQKELESQEINQLATYGQMEAPYHQKPQKGHPDTFLKVHGQAKIQLKGRVENKLVHQYLEVMEERGLNRLPSPSAGAVYFDIEGDHFYEDGGLEYLLGYAQRDPSGELVYHALWAKNRAEEKEIFEQFIDEMMAIWKQYPNCYIYHYGAYEPAALKRLSTRHATREKEVDDLLRAQRFVDFLKVIKESMQASVEGYSLKDMEAFAGYERAANLREASAARRKLGSAFAFGLMETMKKDEYQLIEAYNQDDCLATASLHDWLNGLFEQQVARGIELTRPPVLFPEVKDDLNDELNHYQELYQQITQSLPEDKDTWTDEDQASWLLAHLIEYYRREEKTAWWEFFTRHEMEYDELLEERKAITYLQYRGERTKKGNQTPIDRYYFPKQEISIGKDDKAVAIKGENLGSIRDISIEEGWIDIKKKRATADTHPDAIHINDIFNHKVLASSLLLFIEQIASKGMAPNGTRDAAKELLMSHGPRFIANENPLLNEALDLKAKAIEAALQLDHSVLAIQGPPGTGKTHIGALMIIELIKAKKKVGITAVSHKAVRNLLGKVLSLSQQAGLVINCTHKLSGEMDGTDGITELFDNGEAVGAAKQGSVTGGSIYLWAREEATECVDYLFVDEAGQMSLANVIAAARATKNIILLGDPQQLEQPQQGAHPEGADISALQHLLDGHATIRPEKGLFLDKTWRMPTDICHFISEQYYESRLSTVAGLDQQGILGDPRYGTSGLMHLSVDHAGNTNQSEEEVTAIAQQCKELVAAKLQWQDREGNIATITKEDILIVAPYNLQVNALKAVLPDFRIGTVDKFQGQEAPIVIYSMTSSSPEEAPRGMSFLYSPNRLNVAISRAQCLTILVATPALFKPECHAIDQMRWANGLCRFLELTNKKTML